MSKNHRVGQRHMIMQIFMMFSVTSFALIENTVVPSTSECLLSAVRVWGLKLFSDWVFAVLINFSRSQEFSLGKKATCRTSVSSKMTCSVLSTIKHCNENSHQMLSKALSIQERACQCTGIDILAGLSHTESTYLWKESPVNRI